MELAGGCPRRVGGERRRGHEHDQDLVRRRWHSTELEGWCLGRVGGGELDYIVIEGVELVGRCPRRVGGAEGGAMNMLQVE